MPDPPDEPPDRPSIDDELAKLDPLPFPTEDEPTASEPDPVKPVPDLTRWDEPFHQIDEEERFYGADMPPLPEPIALKIAACRKAMLEWIGSASDRHIQKLAWAVSSRRFHLPSGSKELVSVFHAPPNNLNPSWHLTYDRDVNIQGYRWGEILAPLMNIARSECSSGAGWEGILTSVEHACRLARLQCQHYEVHDEWLDEDAVRAIEQGQAESVVPWFHPDRDELADAIAGWLTYFDGWDRAQARAFAERHSPLIIDRLGDAARDYARNPGDPDAPTPDPFA